MKDPADTITAELIPSPKGRGRPKTGKAMTPAERKAAQRKRDRKAVALIVEKPHQIPPRVIAQLAAQSQDYIAFAAWLEIGERRGWLSSAQRIALRDAKLAKA